MECQNFWRQIVKSRGAILGWREDGERGRKKKNTLVQGSRGNWQGADFDFLVYYREQIMNF